MRRNVRREADKLTGDRCSKGLEAMVKYSAETTEGFCGVTFYIKEKNKKGKSLVWGTVLREV